MEPVVSCVLVGLIVIEDIVAVYGPSACNPLMEFLVDDALLGKLIVELLLCRDLELGVHTLALIVVMLMVVIIMAVATCASHRLISKSVNILDNESSLLSGQHHEGLGVHICYLNYNYYC